MPPDPSKPVRVAVEGFQGPGCTSLTENLQAALGQTVSSMQTDEYDQADVKQVKQQELQG